MATLAAPPAAGSPWQLLYAAAHRLRVAWFQRHAAALPRPVISIGNLHWGGTGKTPVVAAVARHLRHQGAEVCILSRGYGGRGRGVRVVSRGAGPLLTAEEAGDEPVQLAGELPGVAVVVGPDRHRDGLEALARLRPAPDLFLLDDGFSHLALRRDLDLLVFPASDPFGGGRLWPGGRLREPLAAVARASAVLLTCHVAAPSAGAAGAAKDGDRDGGRRAGTGGGNRAARGTRGDPGPAGGSGRDPQGGSPKSHGPGSSRDRGAGGGSWDRGAGGSNPKHNAEGSNRDRSARGGSLDHAARGGSLDDDASGGSLDDGAEAGSPDGGGEALAAALRSFGFTGPGFGCPIRAGTPLLHTAQGPVPLAPGSRVILVSAVARPEAFAASVRKLDFAVMDELRFADHHAYPAASLARIAASVQATAAAAVLVTSKDAVKLMGRLSVPLAELPVAADPQEELWQWLDRAVAALDPHRAAAGGAA